MVLLERHMSTKEKLCFCINGIMLDLGENENGENPTCPTYRAKHEELLRQ